MPRLCLILLALCFALHTTPSSADDKSPTPAPDLYNRAVKNLNDGMWFNDDIADLTEAVRQEPKNSDYHLALGCAEVDRAGSLAYAAFMTDQLLNDNAQYHKDYAKWQAAQANPKSGDYGKPAPPPPPTPIQFRTKDDLTHLKLTGKEAVKRIIALGIAALFEWKEAVQLAKAPAEKAQAESVQGWGLQYERNLLTYTDYAKKHIAGAPTQADVIAAFTAATKDDPTNAAYWEGLGDARAFAGLEDQDSQPGVIRAWQQSLALNPGNVGLRFRLLLAQQKSDPKAALVTAEALAETDTGNSYIQYFVAGLLFKQVHYNQILDMDYNGLTSEQIIQRRAEIAKKLVANDDPDSKHIATEAVSAIERGNIAIGYNIPAYTPPIPKILWPAWNYWSRLFGHGLDAGNYAALRELARTAGGYAIVAAMRGDTRSGARASWASIGIGQKLEGNWPTTDHGPDDFSIITVLVGAAVEAIGYANLQQVYEIAGDPTMVQETAAERAAAKQRTEEYKKLERQALQENTFHLYNNY